MAIWEKVTSVTTPSWSTVTILNSITYLLRNVWESFTVLSWDNEVRRWDDLTN